jgi:hypothetical protein
MTDTLKSLEATWGPDVAQGLRRLAEPPDWLVAIKDPERVGAALTSAIPELRDGRVSLRECEALRVRLRDGSWSGQYRLVVEEDDEERTVKLLGVLRDADDAPPEETMDKAFGSEGWSCYAPELRLELRVQPPDAALVSLPALTDPQEARVLLEKGMRSVSPAYESLTIEACRPQIMRYKPDRRCTILYQIDYPLEDRRRGWPTPVVAKTHHGVKGRNAHESMMALWDSPLRHSSTVTVAEPLGFLPEENVVLQGPIKEDVSLKDQLRLSLHAGTPEEMNRLRALLAKTARGLSELHGSGVTSGKVVTFEDELAEVRGRVERLERFVPEIIGAADPLFDLLESIARAHPADPAVPSHRSFRPAQVLISGDDIGFIDFDSFCQAEPALDLSLFVSVLRDLSMRALQKRDGRPGPGEPARAEHLALVDDLSTAFLDAYEAATSVDVTRARVDLWHALEVWSRIVDCWIKDRPERLPHCMQLLTHLYAREGLTELVA